MRAACALLPLIVGSSPLLGCSLITRERFRRFRQQLLPPLVRLQAVLDLPKSLWASGFDAKFAAVPEQPRDGPLLTWTTEAEKIFGQRYRDVHFPPEGCPARAAENGFFSARTDMEWGVTSVIRDVEDQLLFGLLEGRFVAFSKEVRDEPTVKEAMSQYEQCQRDADWLEDCYFEKLTGCTPDYLAGRLPSETAQLDRRTFQVTFEPFWFLERSQPIWDEMVKANAVHWRDKSGQLVDGLALLELDDEARMRVEAAHRLAMFRALLLQVAFQPNLALHAAIAGIENRTELAKAARNGSLTVVHVRRTDKLNDFLGGSQTVEEKSAFDRGNGSVIDTLTTLSDVLLPWLEGASGHIPTLFVMSDDWHMFEPQALDALTGGLTRPPHHVLWDPRSAETQPKDEQVLQQGNEAWGHKADVSMYILAAAFAMGKWADNIVGCGSSGVSQLMAQLAGGRIGVDPNALGVWEDDAVTLGSARTQVQASRATATSRGVLQFWPLELFKLW